MIKKNDNSENHGLHFLYITTGLVIVIIYLATKVGADNANLLSYLSFGSTLTSLVLAILAIIFSFLSSTSMSNSIELMNRAARDVSDSTKIIDEANRRLESKIDEIPKSVDSLKADMELIRGSFEGNQQTNMGSETTNAADNANERAKSFLKTSSFSGLRILFALKLAFDEQTHFDYEEFFKSKGLSDNYEYDYGFLVATSSSGFIDYSQTKKIFFIKEFDDYISNNIETVIRSRAEKSELKEEWNQEIEKIKNFKSQ